MFFTIRIVETTTHGVEEHEFEDVSSSIIVKKDEWEDVVDAYVLLTGHDLHQEQSFDFFVAQEVIC